MDRSFCGLDFGTSNSTMGYSIDGKSHLVQLGINKPETRTVIFWDNEEDRFYYGDTAIERFMQGNPGRFIQSLKSFLNSKEAVRTVIGGKNYSLEEIISLVVCHFREKFSVLLDGSEPDSVLVGRPVKFHDEDKNLDSLAEERLRKSILSAGFKNVEFQLEPIAAARTFRTVSGDDGEMRILVADFGGGTSDFSIVDLKKGNDMEVISNSGAYVAGNAFDYQLSVRFFSEFLGNRSRMRRAGGGELDIPTWPYFMLSDWKQLHLLAEKKNANLLKGVYCDAIDKEKFGRLMEVVGDTMLGYEYFKLVEGSKRGLSVSASVGETVDFFRSAFDYYIDRSSFEGFIQNELTKIRTALEEAFTLAGTTTESVSRILLVGGTGQTPAVKNLLEDVVGPGKILSGDVFNAVGEGLSVEAEERFR